MSRAVTFFNITIRNIIKHTLMENITVMEIELDTQCQEKIVIRIST